MCGQDRLRPPHVRVGRHQRVARVGRRDRRGRQSACAAARCSTGTRRFRYRRRSTATCSLRDRPGVQTTSGIADARRQLALDEGVHVLVLAVPRRCRRTRGRSGRVRESRASAESIDAPSAAEITPARSSPSAHARLPRTSSSNSRRSNRNDAPNAKRAASGSPSNRPDHRCAMFSAPTVVEGVLAALRAAVSMGRPQILMKPSVALRSNTSPAS